LCSVDAHGLGRLLHAHPKNLPRSHPRGMVPQRTVPRRMVPRRSPPRRNPPRKSLPRKSRLHPRRRLLRKGRHHPNEVLRRPPRRSEGSLNGDCNRIGCRAEGVIARLCSRILVHSGSNLNQAHSSETTKTSRALSPAPLSAPVNE